MRHIYVPLSEALRGSTAYSQHYDRSTATGNGAVLRKSRPKHHLVRSVTVRPNTLRGIARRFQTSAEYYLGLDALQYQASADESARDKSSAL